MKARLALLLFPWLIMAAAWARQPAPAGIALIDSREECVTMQGTWKPDQDGWRAACEMPWRRDECLRLGGAWTEIAKAGAGGRCLAPVSELATAQQCLDHGGNWSPRGARAPECSFDAPKPQVRAAKATDAGKRCDSQKDCTYGCVYEGPAVADHADVLGRCRATNKVSGCLSLVESGRLAGSICAK